MEIAIQRTGIDRLLGVASDKKCIRNDYECYRACVSTRN